MVTQQRVLPMVARAAVAMVAAALVLWPAAWPARANGNPVSVVLSYLSGVSNFGPNDATGVADLVPREGEVKVTVTGLPQLSGERYVAWLTKSGTSETFMLGGFNTGADRTGRLNLTLPEAVPDRGWDTVLVTVESGSGNPAAPSERRSIAGRFPTPAQSGTTGTAAAVQATRPPQLPSTGGNGIDPAPVTVPPPSVPEAGVSPAIYFGAAGLLAVVAMAAALLRRSAPEAAPRAPTGRGSRAARRGKR